MKDCKLKELMTEWGRTQRNHDSLLDSLGNNKNGISAGHFGEEMAVRRDVEKRLVEGEKRLVELEGQIKAEWAKEPKAR